MLGAAQIVSAIYFELVVFLIMAAPAVAGWCAQGESWIESTGSRAQHPTHADTHPPPFAAIILLLERTDRMLITLLVRLSTSST